MLKQIITRNDVLAILKEVQVNLPSHKYDVGQKVISELCSKLFEQVTAQHFNTKLGIPVVAGSHDVDPDVIFMLPTGSVPLEIKVAQNQTQRCRWRGGSLSDRNNDFIFVSRNKDCTEFFVAIVPMVKADWGIQKTAYYGTFFTEEMLFAKNPIVLCGGFSKQTKGRRVGKPTIVFEKI